jgi:hypothetical protein
MFKHAYAYLQYWVKVMPEERDNKEDYSPAMMHIPSSSLTDSELLEVFNALGSQGFRFLDYHEN